MINRSATRQPVAAFNIPPNAPKEVTTAAAAFDRGGDAYGIALGELDDLRDERRAAIANAKAANVAAVRAGDLKRIDVAALEREYDDKIAAKQDEIETLAVAVDQVGNELAHSIAEHRPEYIANQGPAADDAARRLVDGLAQLRAAIRDLGPARGSLAWLSQGDEGEAVVGRAQEFRATAVFVDTTAIPHESSVRPEVLLAALEQLVK